MARTDGEIVISTTLVTSEFEKDYNKLQQKLEKEQLELNIKATDLEQTKQELKEVQAQLQEIINKRQEINKQLKLSQKKQSDIQSNIQAIKDSGGTIPWSVINERESTNKKISELTIQQEQLNKEYDKFNNLVNKANAKLTKTEASYNLQKEQVGNIKKEFSALAQEIENANEKAKHIELKNIQDQLKKINQTTGNVIGKVIKWGLALFSIRSAYNFIRSAISTLSTTNAQIGADIEYIRWVLANTLKPIIETIIKLAYTLLQYINYISIAWFGVNLFANATAEAFKKSKDNLKGANKEAKELQKTLAGFDEMNILQENGSTAKGGGGGGVTLPTTDLSEVLPDVEIPGWVKWIAENGETLAGIIIGIGTAFATWKILDLISGLGFLGDSFTSFQQLLISLGIGLIFKGIYDVIENWGEDVKGVISGVGEVIMGLGTMLVGINPTAWWSWAILGVGFLLELIPHLIDTRTKTEKIKDAQDQLNESQQKYIDANKKRLNAFENAKKAADELKQVSDKLGKAEDEVRTIGEKLVQAIGDEERQLEDLTPDELAIYKAYINNVDAQQQLVEANKEVADARKKQIEDNLNLMETTANTTEEWIKYGREVVDANEKAYISSDETAQRLNQVFWKLPEQARLTFAKEIPDEIAKTITALELMDEETGKIEFFGKDTFEKTIPNSLKKTQNSVKDTISVFDTLSKKINNLKGTNIKITTSSSGGSYPQAKGGIVTKLATGAIVNRPGAGVPVASSYMGEAGREGIIPLTDAQAMETLGQAIGKYISINATIPVYAYNRQIAREIRKIEADDDFAFNR